MKTLNLTKGMILGVVTLLISTLLLGVLMQPAKADYDGGPVRSTWDRTGMSPKEGSFFINGSGLRPNSVGICSDPALDAPPGSLDGSVNFQTHSIREYIMAHPRLSRLSETEGDSKKVRERQMALLMYSISPDIEPEHESLLWDRVWGEYQASGLQARYGTSKEQFKKFVIHFMLGAVSNYSYSAGISTYPSDIANFLRTRVFAPNFNDNADKWLVTGLIALENSLTQSDLDEIIKSVRVINIHNQGYQAIFINTEVNTKVKLNLTKVSQIPAFTDNNPLYSLNGAVYGVFSDEATAQKVGELRVGANGQSNTLELKKGIYYVKEITSPPSYELDPTVYSVNLTQ